MTTFIERFFYIPVQTQFRTSKKTQNTLSNLFSTLLPFSLVRFLHSATLIADALYLHSKPGKDNKPQEVYDFITEIEGKDHSPYFFENSTSIKRFTRHLASLLAHPLQRAEQNSSLGTFVAQ